MLVPWRTRSHRHAQAMHTASLQCSTQVTALLVRVPPIHFPLCFTTCQMNRVCFRAMGPTPVGLRGTCSTLLNAEAGDNCSHCLIKLRPGHRKSVWALNPGRAFMNFWRPFFFPLMLQLTGLQVAACIVQAPMWVTSLFPLHWQGTEVPWFSSKHFPYRGRVLTFKYCMVENHCVYAFLWSVESNRSSALQGWLSRCWAACMPGGIIRAIHWNGEGKCEASSLQSPDLHGQI